MNSLIMNNGKLDVIILTRNEEKNLPYALESVKSLKVKVWVVDSGSTDGTERIAKAAGAEVVSHTEYVNQAQQFNWALDNLPLEGEWVLRLDADEWLTPELAEEIKDTVDSDPPVNGYYLPRRVYFMGRWMRHGGYYPTWILRLFRRGKARSDNRPMDEHIALSEGVAERLTCDFADENRKGLSEWVRKHNDYASREAVAVREGNDGESGQKKTIYYRTPPFLRALIYFCYRYFLRLGFLDGIPGLAFHFLQGFWYRFLIDAKLYEMKRESRTH